MSEGERVLKAMIDEAGKTPDSGPLTHDEVVAYNREKHRRILRAALEIADPDGGARAVVRGYLEMDGGMETWEMPEYLALGRLYLAAYPDQTDETQAGGE